MRKRTSTAILFVLSLLLIISCQRNEPDVELSDNYYPLAYGYEWTYDQLEGSQNTRRIIEESVINDITYYRDENDYSDYYRTEDNILYRYRRTDNVEYAIIDFNKPIDFEWRDPVYGRTYKILAKNATYGSIEKCILIASESDLDYTETLYAPGIGMVRAHSEGRGGTITIGGNTYCISATINGETISFEE